jgi:hypothetical protein
MQVRRRSTIERSTRRECEAQLDADVRAVASVVNQLDLLVRELHPQRSRSSEVEPSLKELVKPEPMPSAARWRERLEACFKRLRPRSSSSAALYLRWRKPLATFAMVRRADQNAEFCPALRRSRCTRRHMAPLGGLRSSAQTELAVGAAQNKNKSRRSTISAKLAMVARVRRMATGLTTTTSGCSPSRSTIFRHRPMRPARRSSERHASTPSRKRSLLVGTRDSVRRVRGSSGS